MATLTIEGHKVTVDDSFLKLSPDQQNATVEEIAKSLGAAPQQAAPVKVDPTTMQPAGVPEYQPPGVSGYDPQTGNVSSANDRVGAFITGANDVPILGPAMKAGTSAAAAGLVTPFSDKSFSENYDQMRGRQEQVMADNPGTALAGNIAGSALLLRGAPNSAIASKALGMSGSLPARIGFGALSNGLISGADTAVRGGDLGDVAGSTAIGAATGGALPAIGAGLGGAYSAVKDKVGGIVRGALNPAGEAGKRVASAMKIDARNSVAGVLAPADIAAAQRNGQPLMNADLGGEQTRALARAAANQSPEARGAMERVTSDRFADQGNRVVRMVNRLTGGKTDDLLAVAGIKDQAAAANQAAYNHAYAQPAAQDMWHQGFQQLMQAPAMQEAARDTVKRGANRAAAEGFQAVKNPFVEVNGKMMLKVNRDGSVARPTLQFWNQVKRNLDGQVGVAQRTGDQTHAADLMALKSKLITTLDQAVPEYKAARQGAAAFFGAEDAVDAGKMFAKSSRMLPEYQRGLAVMKPAEKEAFETGFASELIDQAKTTNDRTNVITRMFKSPEARQKMSMAFGPQRAREIEAFVRVETAMDSLRGAFGNSTTARQLIESGVIGGGTWWYTGDFNKGIAAAALSHGARYAGKKIDGNVMTKTAEMLLSNDPQLIAKAVQGATMSPQHMAALDALTKMVGVGSKAGAIVGASQAPALLHQ
jgi:hypothetical protein